MKDNLYDILADKWIRKNGSVYIYSDPHFGDLDSYMLRHVVGIEIRDGETYYQTGPGIFEDIASLNCSHYYFDEDQVKAINSKCGKNDTLILLGDIGDINYIKRLKAKHKVLILGNHDKGASNYKRNNYYTDMFGNTTDNKLFDEVYEGPLMINDRVILSHEPINVPDYMFNIHGHIHDKDLKGDDHHLNVCAESINYTPVNLISLLKKGMLKDIKNIHRVTINEATERKNNEQYEEKAD